MSATTKQIRAGIAANISANPNIASFAQVSAHQLTNPTPPFIWVFPDEIDYHQAMQNGLDKRMFIVQAVVAMTGDQAAEDNLDQLLDDGTEWAVKDAIESDPTLGGIVDDTTVTRCSGYQEVSLPKLGRSYAAAPYVGAQWEVEVTLTP